eukprot:superscaffoldBa00004849_g19530
MFWPPQWQSNQLSHCHPPRHPIHQQNEAMAANENSSFPPAAFLGPAQPIRRGLLVHLTLFLAKHNQSQRLQHT